MAEGYVDTCPKCGRAITVSPELIGQQALCQKCGTSITFLESGILPSSEVPPVIGFQQTRSNSLGISSLILGVVAFAICWIPLLGIAGIPLSALGFILGMAGLILSIRRKGYGIGFSVAGSGTCALALAVSILVTWAIVSDKSRLREKEAKEGKETDALVSEILAEPEWLDASKNVAYQGDLNIGVSKAWVGKVAIEYLGDKAESTEKHLIMVVRMRNLSDTKKINYRGWSTDEDINRVELTDNFGNSYRMSGFGVGTEIVGQKKREAIHPGQITADLLVFERPLENANFLKLSLPARNFGGSGKIGFQIPKSMIESN